MPPTEAVKMGLHRQASQCFKQDCESILEEWNVKNSSMKCFGSCQFLRGLWMDLSGEVADIHIVSDAKNLVTTARTIHLPEQKETIHMISMLRKEACSGSFS